MVELDLVRVPLDNIVSKVRQAGYYQSPVFENDLPVDVLRDIRQLVLDKLY